MGAALRAPGRSFRRRLGHSLGAVAPSIKRAQQPLHGVERVAVQDAIFLDVEQVGELHADPELRDPAGHHLGREERWQVQTLGLSSRQRGAHGLEHELLPGQKTRQELLAQLGVGQARGPQFGLHAHEPGGEVAFVEAARLGPLSANVLGP